MPKIFGREIPTIVLGLGTAVAAYLVYAAVSPGDAPATASKKAKPPVKKTVGETDYLDTDYTFQIDPLSDSTTPKDAFKPLVIKSTIGANGIQSIDNYTYSGMADLDSVSYGLLENGTTGQGDFVKPGEKWHDQWLVISIDPNEIKLRNDGGDVTTLQAGAAAAKASSNAGPALANQANNPTGNPMMVGPIGGPQDMTLQQDPTQMGSPGGNGRRNRGRGGNRGGGGGRGGVTPDGG